jgi:hypothetical protein
MAIFTKRNALIGWATWLVGKRVVKSRTGASGGHKKKSIVAAAAAGLATAGGALLFWRKRKGDEGHEGQSTGS